MARHLHDVHPAFDAQGYLAACVKGGFEKLELKARMAFLGDCLRAFLPADYPRAVDVLVAAAPHVPTFDKLIFTAFVEVHGLDHLEDSLRAMKELTRGGTAEFAIRPFIIRYEKRMLEVLAGWATDPDEHVRRLAAEGSRPRGVWTLHIESFKKDPRPVLEILDLLKEDPSKYVRTAVANSLNDMSKDHPKLVIRTASLWSKSSNAGTKWIIRHACRSLIKSGHPEVFGLLGFAYPPKVELRGAKVTPRTLAPGDTARFSFELLSQVKKAQRLAIDYRVSYANAGRRTPMKVFKLAEKTLPPLGTMPLSGKHWVRETSNRRHKPGRHSIEILVNGQPLARMEVTLKATGGA
jgi:3-methyladenine DNA glycosylase AlkC